VPFVGVGHVDVTGGANTVWWDRPKLRKLTAEDVGQVFRRVVDGVLAEDFFLLWAHTDGQFPGDSFITFRIADGKLTHVGETGYFNMPFYREAEYVPASTIAEARRIHDEQVRVRLLKIDRAVEEQRAEDRRIRALCGHPDTWFLIRSSLPTSHEKVTVFIWFEPHGPYWIDLCVDGRIIATRSARCSSTPDVDNGGSNYWPIVEELCGKGGIVETTLSEPAIIAQIQ
jgi:hypothetical protein